MSDYTEHLISMAGGDGEPDLDAIQARADAATEGPWEVDAMDSGHSRFEMSVWITAGKAGDSVCDMDGLSRSRNDEVALDDGYKDAKFIAAARTDVPALLDVVRSQQAKIERVNELVRYLDRLAPGDKHYAGLIRAALTATEGAA